MDSFYPGLQYRGIGLGRDGGIYSTGKGGREGKKRVQYTTTAIKWLFVGLNLPCDLDLGSLDGEGRVGG